MSVILNFVFESITNAKFNYDGHMLRFLLLQIQLQLTIQTLRAPSTRVQRTTHTIKNVQYINQFQQLWQKVLIDKRERGEAGKPLQHIGEVGKPRNANIYSLLDVTPARPRVCSLEVANESRRRLVN